MWAGLNKNASKRKVDNLCTGESSHRMVLLAGERGGRWTKVDLGVWDKTMRKVEDYCVFVIMHDGRVISAREGGYSFISMVG